MQGSPGSTVKQRFPGKGRVFAGVAIGLSLVLNVALAYQNQQLRSKFALARILGRLPQPGFQYPVFSARSGAGDTITIGSAPSHSRQLLLVLTRSCQYCAATVPVWDSLLRKVRTSPGPPVQTAAIALDSASATESFLRARGLLVPVISFPERRLAQLARATQVPQTIVLDSEGWILFAHTGVLRGRAGLDSLDAALVLGGRR